MPMPRYIDAVELLLQHGVGLKKWLKYQLTIAGCQKHQNMGFSSDPKTAMLQLKNAVSYVLVRAKERRKRARS